jgi:hypothetical protein
MDTDWLRTQLMDGRSYESTARDVAQAPVNRGVLGQEDRLQVRVCGPLLRQRRDRQRSARVVDRERPKHQVNGYTSRPQLPGGPVLVDEARPHDSAWRTSPCERTRTANRGGRAVPCPRHGVVAHRQRADNGCYRCLKCRADAVVQRRRRVKATLVAEHGGRCVICGFDAIPEALQFHHLDPSAKSFAVSTGGLSRSLARARAEAAKCVLLCANCHAAVEAGKERLPLGSGPSEEVVED